MDQLIQTLQPYFTTKAPVQLPETWRQTIVKLAPWVVLIIVVLSVLALLPLLGAIGFIATSSALLYSSLGYANYTLIAWVSFIGFVTEIILYIMAYPGLKATTIKGWNYVFYASLVSVVVGVINWVLYLGNVSGLLGTAISALISFYILFQIREHYTGAKKVVATSATE